MKTIRLFLLMALTALCLPDAKAAPSAYAYRSQGNPTLLRFCYDERTPEQINALICYPVYEDAHEVGWQSDAETQRLITKVVFEPSFADFRPQSCKHWFYNMANLTEISGLDYLNTSEVTNMNGMFCGCKSLTHTTFSAVMNFDTSNVTDMTFMFWECQNMAQFDMRNWNFTKVQSSAKMFYNCSSLHIVQLPSTANLLKANAFEGVGSTSDPCLLIYPNSFKPMPVDLYDGCFKWKGGFFLDSRKPYAWLSEDGKTLSFHNDDSLVVRQGSIFDIYITGNEDKINSYPEWQTDSRVDRSIIEKVVIAPSFRLTRPITCYGWFRGMYKLTDIEGLDNLKTSLVQNMEWMFYNCSKLTEIDLSFWDTNDVTSTKYMFMNCYRLKYLNLSNFNFTRSSESMFGYCYGLRTLIVSDSANNLYGTGSVSSESEACYGIGKYRADYNPDSERCVLVGPEGWSPSMTSHQTSTGYFTFKGGLFIETATPYVALSPDKKTLTFLNDRGNESLHSKGYTIYWLPESGTPDWQSERASIENVVIDPSFVSAKPTTCYNWFSYMQNLTEITGLEYLNTSASTSMSQMFFMCNKLTNLDLSHFDTSNVLYMINMFYGCSKLTSLDVSSFNTSKVTNMNSMFYGCSKLTTLDVSSFDTSNVTDMYSMFDHCEGLTSLDVSSFNTAKVTDFRSMFRRLLLVPTLDISNFTISADAKTTNMLRQVGAQLVIYGSPVRLVIPASAASLDAEACDGVGSATLPCTLEYPSDFTPEKTSTGDGYYVWKSGYFKDVEPEPYAVLNEGRLTFYYDTSRGTRTGTVYDLNEGEEQPAWYADRESVTKVTFNSSFKDARPTSCASWFADMTNLTSVSYKNLFGTITYLNTSEVTTMKYMFRNCTSLSSIDVYLLDTRNVTDMTGMFYKCSSLTKLDFGNQVIRQTSTKPTTVVSKFNTSKVTNMKAMFYGCSSLKEFIGLDKFNTSNVTTMRTMFAACPVEVLDLHTFNTSKVTDMYGMFTQCSELEEVNLTGFDTSNVEDMFSLFAYCINLKTIDGLSGFDTSHATNMAQMFALCPSLDQVDVSHFDTSSASLLQFMFYGCTGLTSLDVSSFTIPEQSEETATYSMFGDCKNLTKLVVPATGENLVDGACALVGTEEAPCSLVGPAGFTPVAEASGDGWILWKDGYFSYFRKGDVNHDRMVTIADVMMTVSHILGQTSDKFYETEADINGDSDISIADVMLIIKIILN